MLTTTNAKLMAIKESDLKYWENPQYNKLGLIAHQIKTYLNEIAPTRSDGKKMKKESKLTEADLDQAEVLLAAQELVDDMQKMVEDVAEMQVQKLMPIVDAMKEQVGFEVAEAYNNAADAALGTLLDSMKTAKTAVENATLAARGEQTSEPMPTDMGMDDAAMDPEAPMDADMGPDEFGGDEAESGEENPVGRELKGESALANMEKSALAEKKFIDTKDKLFKMVESGAMTQEHFINVINELKNKYGVEMSPYKGDIVNKYSGAPMMGDLGDGKGMREIKPRGGLADTPTAYQEPDKGGIQKMDLRKGDAGYNAMQTYLKAKDMSPAELKKGMDQSTIKVQKTPTQTVSGQNTGTQGRRNRRSMQNTSKFDLGDMFNNLTTKFKSIGN